MVIGKAPSEAHVHAVIFFLTDDTASLHAVAYLQTTFTVFGSWSLLGCSRLLLAAPAVRLLGLLLAASLLLACCCSSREQPRSQLPNTVESGFGIPVRFGRKPIETGQIQILIQKPPCNRFGPAYRSVGPVYRPVYRPV